MERDNISTGLLYSSKIPNLQEMQASESSIKLWKVQMEPEQPQADQPIPPSHIFKQLDTSYNYSNYFSC